MKNVTRVKANGVHYTPPDLARFLAQVVWQHFLPLDGRIRVLDPACGDGALLRALAQTAPDSLRQRLVLVGYETDSSALARAGRLLVDVQARELLLQPGDFLSQNGLGLEEDTQRLPLFSGPRERQASASRFDIVIANPPYVRTQILGSRKAQLLARRFNLTGRVDLYQAFVKAMASALRPQGTMGLLTSNRFMFVQSGMALRHLLTTQFDLKAIYDLGDTKLFTASVLPVVVVARKGEPGPDYRCTFHRVYEDRAAPGEAALQQSHASILDALRTQATGMIPTANGTFVIQRGVLPRQRGSTAPWFLETPENRRWLETVSAHQACTFDDVAKIRVGIKTTADQVFIREDWNRLPPEQRPEPELLRPIITHTDAALWCLRPDQLGPRRVLYPHQVRQGKREAVPLDAYPRARAYLESHRTRLAARRYVAESGRQWYELWVPQDPNDWAKPKIVFPDISEHPRFFFDRSGAIVNGDCYWITLKREKNPRWLLLMLAVANSSLITTYYDTLIHNKLYSGRRRFMTQYVKKFPLPRPDSAAARHILTLLSKAMKQRLDSDDRSRLEAQIDEAVWESFGLLKEVRR